MTKGIQTIRRIISDFYMVLILIFLYAPILTMMVLSFNQSKSRTSGAVLRFSGMPRCLTAVPLWGL